MPSFEATIFLSGTAQLAPAINSLEASKLEQLFRCPSARNAGMLHHHSSPSLSRAGTCNLFLNQLKLRQLLFKDKKVER
jgi:hypothetical protein